MGEFQRQKAGETLLHALASMGLTSSLDIGSEQKPSVMGPGTTTPSSYAEVPAIDQAPRYEQAEPPESTPTEPID